MTVLAGRHWRERTSLSVLLGLGLALGLTWTFLPGGLVFDPVLRDAQAAAGTARGMFALQSVPLILLSLFAIAQRYQLGLLVIRELNPWMLLLLAWAFLSMAWAPSPFTVFKQAVGISGASLLPLAFAIFGWYHTRYADVMRPFLTLALLASLLVGLLLPQIGVHSEAAYELNGSWRGITYQKNGLGQISALALILWFHAWASRAVPPSRSIPGIALCVLLLLLSRSSTSFLVGLLACGTILLSLRPALHLGQLRGIVITAAWLMILLPLFLYLMFIGSLDSEELAQSFAQVFGKDATFSGRTQIWVEVIRSIREHPWIGVGFNSFWGGPDSPAGPAIRRIGFPCNSGHNGYLDVINTLGIIGFVLLLAMIRRQFADLGRLRRIDPAPAALHFAILLYVLLVNLTESGWFVPISITHTVAMYSSVVVSRHLFDARVRLAAARQQADAQTLRS